MIFGIEVTSLIAVAGLAVMAAVVFSLASPIDRRLSKGYLMRILTKCFPDRAIQKNTIKIERFPTPEATPETEDRVFYGVTARDQADNVVRLTVQAYYPRVAVDLKRLQEELEKTRPKDDMSSGQMRLPTQTMSGAFTYTESRIENQKKAEEEEQEVNKRINRYEQGIEALEAVGKISELIPRLYFYDKRRLFTFVEYSGGEILKQKVYQADWLDKQKYLTKAVTELATTHECGKHLVGKLVPYYHHNYKLVISLLETALGTLPKGGRPIESEAVRHLVELYKPVASFIDNQAEKGLKLSNCSPYNLFVFEETIRLRDWEGIRRDVIALDLAELLRDPVTGISLEQERQMLDVYCRRRSELDADFDSEVFRKEYDLVASIHSLNQSGYVAQYLSWERRTKAQGKKLDVEMPNWNLQGLRELLEKTIDTLTLYDESREFAAALKEAVSAYLEA